MKSKTMNNSRIWVCIFLLLTLFISRNYAQQKKILTQEDYKLWSNTWGFGMSTDGKWISFHVNQGGKDTLYIQNSGSNLRYGYPFATANTFSGDGKWLAFMKKDSLNLINLKTNKSQTFESVSSFSFIQGGRFLLGYGSGKANNTLFIKDMKTLKTTRFENISESSINADQTQLAVITEENGSKVVKYIVVKSSLRAKMLTSNVKNSYGGLTWNKTGTSLAFYEQTSDDYKRPVISKIYVYKNTAKNSLLKVINPQEVSSFPQDFSPIPTTLYLSDDGKQLFLYLKPKINNAVEPVSTINDERNDVQIWHPDNVQLPPVKGTKHPEPEWYVWWIGTSKVLAVADKIHPNIVLTGDQKKALLFNNTDYLPQYKYTGKYIDVYLKDLLTGDKKLLIKKVLRELGHVQVSPSGKYITYFKDKHWWVYNIAEGTHKCITKSLDVSFEDIEDDYAGAKPPYGNLGWLDDDKQLILYDQFDIWMITPDGVERRKITDGRKASITYRIYHPGYWTSEPGILPGFKAKAYSTQSAILLTSLNNRNLDQGLYSWSEKTGLKKLVRKDMKIAPAIEKNEVSNERGLLFVESNFDVSPRLMLRLPSGKERLVYQSNPQQKDYFWGKSELIHYSSDGKQLKGALFYPANYDPGKKYPMIVHVYEKRSRELHNYVSPVQNPQIGFNYAIFTSEGYFVLLPDIAYTLNEPGISATKCVVAATESIIEKGLVDRHRIGLMGYSFGGYESSFIISQTNLFRAAISGAGPHDPLDWYLSVSPSGSNIWRFENQQGRIQSPFYGAEFRRNSTLTYVTKINTPLLLFTGAEDTQVDWQQSRKLHIALWRLGKQSTLLLYPGDAHGGFSEIHDKDITMRVKGWFDYYLKDQKPAEWMHIK